jgi:hypothetical protein
MDSEVLQFTSASYWIIFALMLVLGGMVGLGFWRRRQFAANWAELADHLNLAIHGGFLDAPVVSGVYRKRAVMLRSYIPCGTRNTWTKMMIEVDNPSRGSLLITRQGELERIGKRLGMLDQRVGDMAFDLHYLINSNPSELVSWLLGDRPDLRRCMLEGDIFRLELDGNELVCTHDRLEQDVDYLKATLNSLGELAERIDSLTVPSGGALSFTEA